MRWRIENADRVRAKSRSQYRTSFSTLAANRLVEVPLRGGDIRQAEFIAQIEQQMLPKPAVASPASTIKGGVGRPDANDAICKGGLTCLRPDRH